MTVLPKIAFFSHFVQVSDITTNFLKNLANLDFLIFRPFSVPRSNLLPNFEIFSLELDSKIEALKRGFYLFKHCFGRCRLQSESKHQQQHVQILN